MSELSIIQQIQNSEEIVSFFGYWPTFHDDTLEDLSHDFKNKKITVTLSSQEKISHWTFEFSNISSLIVQDREEKWKDKTIIFGIEIKKENDDFIFEIEPSMGSYIKITSKVIRVKKLF